MSQKKRDTKGRMTNKSLERNVTEVKSKYTCGGRDVKFY